MIRTIGITETINQLRREHSAPTSSFADLHQEAEAIQAERQHDEARQIERRTRALLIDAFLQARDVNRIDVFTEEDLDDLDSVEVLAARLEQRRARIGGRS